MEEWRDIKGYEGLYQVSSLGNIRALKFYHSANNVHNVKTTVNKHGYCVVGLYKDKKCKQFRVHRLVALAFIPNPDNLPYVNHIDCDKTNNKSINLEWCTQSDNVKHGYDHDRYDRKKLVARNTKAANVRWHGDLPSRD